MAWAGDLGGKKRLWLQINRHETSRVSDTTLDIAKQEYAHLADARRGVEENV
jgi:hypothetical protein